VAAALPDFAADRSFRPDIEGLRAVAVLLVVACHCAVPGFGGGFIGVDVFFVLSGYLMTGLIAAEHRATGRIDLQRFYARRARRLLPACTLTLVLTVVAAAALLSPPAVIFTGRAAASAALYLSNVFFDRTAADYFAPDVAGNPLLHTWSLGVEEQFYLLWPLLLLVADRGPRRSRRARWVLGAAAAASFAFGLGATRFAPTLAFYELPARAWEFAAGGLLALAPIARAAAAARAARLLGIAGLALIVGSGAVLAGGAGFPGWIALVPATGTLLVLHAGAVAPGRGIGRVLGAAPLQFVGERSYSWYLLHWPLVVFAGALFPGLGVPGKLVAGALSLACAAASFRFVERPARRQPYLAERPGLSLGLAGGATLLAASAAYGLIAFGQRLATDTELRALAAATTDVGDLSQRDCVSQGLSPELRTCAFGAADAADTVVLFGDSHAIQWFNPLRTAATAESWRLVTVVKSGCPPGEVDLDSAPAARAACEAWRTRAIEAIRALRPAAIVMASYTGATIRGYRTEPALSTEALRLGVRRTLERLVPAGIPVVLLRDTPLPPFDIPGCVGRRRLQSPRPLGEGCEFDAGAALNAPAFAALRAAAAGLPGVWLLDLSDLICPGASCPAIQHGQLVFRDDNHLTGAFAETLAPALRTRLFATLRDARGRASGPAAGRKPP
jgi:peptidoglycan/LPS O-acetylase OafA/YrhL